MVPDPDLFKGNDPVYYGHESKSQPDKKVNHWKVVADPGSYRISRPLPRIVACTQVFDHHTGIDGEGTGNGTESVSGTGSLSLVTKRFGKISDLLHIISGTAQSLYFTLNHNPLASRKGETIGQTVDLAKATFNALVHRFIDHRHRFEMFQMQLRVLRDDHIGIQDARGIKGLFDLLHISVNLFTPFIGDKGCHIESRAMLGLQRSVIFVHNQPGELKDHIFVLFQLITVMEVLGKYKVEVPIQYMAVDHCIFITKPVQHGSNINHGSSQVFCTYSHIFNNHTGSRLSHSTHRREHSLAYIPVVCNLLQIGCDFKITYQFKSRECLFGPFDQGIQRLLALLLQVDQKGSYPIVERFDIAGNSCIVLHRTECLTVHDLDGRQLCFPQQRNSIAGRFQVLKKDQ